MSFVTWSDNYSVGNLQMDNQHKKLIKMINDLHLAMSQGKGKEVVGRLINDLTNYTVVHFQDEERMMTEINFPRRDEHFRIHEQFVNKVSQFKKDYDNNKITLSMDIMSFLKDWLTDHIQKMDKEYGKVKV